MIASDLSRRRYKTEILWIAVLPALYYISRQNYNLFHSVADGLSIVIAVSVFMIIWNTRRILDNDYLLYLGISFLFFALLDLIHILGNKDMGVFPTYGNLGPALYIASRYVISVSLLVAPLFVKRKLNTSLMFTAYSLVSAFILLSIFYWRNFPVCIVDGVGLTPFKVTSDYIICLILLGAIGLLFVHRGSFDRRVFWIIVFSVILSIATGVAFTFYADPFGITNAVGHFFQIGSFYLVYLAIIETSLTKPQNVLYRKLKQSGEELAESVKRLDHANAGLKEEITAHKQAKESLRESEQKYRSLFENMTSAAVMIAPILDGNGRLVDLRYLMVNPSARTHLGKTPRELVGKRWSEVFPYPGRNPVFDVCEKVLISGEPFKGEVFLPATNGYFDMAVYCPITGRLALVASDITDRKRSEEALRESEQQFRSIIENISEGLMLFDPQRNLIYQNPASLRIHGFEEGQSGKLARDRVAVTWQAWDESGRPVAFEQWPVSRVFRGERVQGQFLRVIRPDTGYEFYGSYNGCPINGPDGKLALGFITIRNVTQQLKAEEALRENERRLSMAVSATADAIWEWNLLTNKTYYSPRWYEMLGYANNEIPMDFDGWKNLCHPDDLQPTLDAIRARLESADDSRYAAEFRMRSRDGLWLWVLGRGRVVERDAAGKPVLLSGTNTDITLRKQAETALRESEARFRLALRNAPVSVAAQDSDLRYTWAYNQRTVRPEEIIGRFDHEIFTPEEAAHVTAIKRRVLEENVEIREQIWFNRPSGRIFLDVCWEPIRNEAGRAIGVASATVDLTPIKLAEDALKESLANKEVLLKEIHHRVKNNMQVMSSLVSLQADESKNSVVREVLQDVSSRVRSMAMVHEKLYQSADLARIDFANYSESLLSYLWRSYGSEASNIRLTTNLEPVPLPVNEAVPCGLILNELITNALKHAFPGNAGGEVIVSLRNGNQGEVVLCVRDNGKGLPDGFDWSQADSLGLRLVQMLAGQLDASVKVSSRKGTEITLTFRSNI